MTQWDFQNKRKQGWTGKNSFVLKVPLRHLRPSVIFSVPCDRILQRAYSGVNAAVAETGGSQFNFHGLLQDGKLKRELSWNLEVSKDILNQRYFNKLKTLLTILTLLEREQSWIYFILSS